MSELPNPLTPADCRLNGHTLPLDMLVYLLVVTFGLSAEDAERSARRFAVEANVLFSEVGHG